MDYRKARTVKTERLPEYATTVRLYQCQSCGLHESLERFVPAKCLCGGDVLQVAEEDGFVVHQRANLSTKDRKEAFEYWGGICHITGIKIDPENDDWDIEHPEPLWAGGVDDITNRKPALRWAHKEKTKVEATARSKGNRIINKRNGFKKSKNPMNGSKASGWKRKMNGETVRR